MAETSSLPRLPPTERVERLVLAASALITEVSLEGVLDRVVAVAAEVIGAQYAAIGVLEPDGRLLESFTTYGIDDELRTLLGPPKKESESPKRVVWHYQERTTDPATSKLDPGTQVVFEKDRVVRVEY